MSPSLAAVLALHARSAQRGATAADRRGRLHGLDRQQGPLETGDVSLIREQFTLTGSGRRFALPAQGEKGDVVSGLLASD